MDSSSEPDPPWQASDLFAVFLLGQVVPVLAFHALLAAGFFVWAYGAELVARAMSKPPVEGAEIAQARLVLWAVCVAFPLQMLAANSLLWQTSRAEPRRTGWTRGGAGPSLLAAVALALIVVPATYGVQAVCLWVVRLAGAPEELHSFAKMAREGLNAVEWSLIFLAACVVAPVWEEFLFRGLVQRWVLGRGAQGESVALAAAVAFAVLYRLDPFFRAETFLDRIGAMAPAWCALGLCLTHPLWPKARRGLFATALFFAFVHSRVWPSPIPLLLLALVLGWLAQRWPTLAGPILLHALFNAVACVLLLVA